jgi:hypothetical protein
VSRLDADAAGRAGARAHPGCETLQLHAGPGNGHEDHTHGFEEFLYRAWLALVRVHRLLLRWLGNGRQVT